jgi:hypothetical protein
MAQKSFPRAGRPAKASATKPAPVRKGILSGSVRNRAQLDVPWNPLGAVNGPDNSGKANTGTPPRKRPQG